MIPMLRLCCARNFASRGSCNSLWCDDSCREIQVTAWVTTIFMLARLRSPLFSRVDLAFMVNGAFLLFASLAVSMLAADVGDALIRNTIRLSLVWYAAALILMMQLRKGDWLATTAQGKAARWCWTWGVTSYLVHVALAFHFFHHWSHAHAYAHTQHVSGFGEGVFGSYLFTCVWAVDALWWWAYPTKYSDRPFVVDVILHMFMLFIAFHGAVVFAQGPVRWASLSVFCGLALIWLFQRAALKPQAS